MHDTPKKKRRQPDLPPLPDFSDEMELVWGRLSGDDLGERFCALDTMNDIELIYWKQTKDYTVNIETIYSFPDREATARYLQGLLAAFTDWMKEQGYDTDRDIKLQDVFPDHNGHHKTIESAYAQFKAMVNGYSTEKEEE